MPHLQNRNNSKGSTCPDSTALSAFMENQLSGSDRDAIAAHLAQCPKCAEVHDRLISFSKVTTAEPDPEWENAEKRLAIWMSGFLDAHSVARQAARAKQNDAWNATNTWNWIRLWKLQWALAAVAVVVLVGGAALLFRPALPWHGQVKEAATQMPTPPMSTTGVTAQGTAPAPPEKPLLTPETIAEGTPPESKGPEKTGTHSGQHVAHNPANQGPLTEGDRQQAENSGKTPPSEGPKSFIARGEAPPPAPANSTAPKPNSAAASKETHPSMELAREPVEGPPSPSRKTAGTTATVAAYHIDADTRLWIKLSSVNRQPDGSFTFRGSLLEPVKQGGTVLLAQGSEVIGSGRVSEGKTSLLIAELVVGGTHYTLKSTGGASNAPAAGGGSAQMHPSSAIGFHAGGTSTVKAPSGALSTNTPGSGPAVNFAGGTVLETWLASPSIYEKAPEQ